MHRPLYPKAKPTETIELEVSELHKIAVKRYGTKGGKPVVFIHGGPGGGTNDDCARFFNPKGYDIFLFDQRGCGQSTPHGELNENTTWNLVDDIEKIRAHYSIDKWQVFGGSWGSTLSLIYAINHPERVSELVIRGIFLGTQAELDHLYLDGTKRNFPEEYERFLSFLQEEEKAKPLDSYYRILTADNKERALEAARHWDRFEALTSTLLPSSTPEPTTESDLFAIAISRIETHYFVNRCFLPNDNYILENIENIKNIPTAIVHGRYDMICSPQYAWTLHKLLPNSRLEFGKCAGHSQFEPDNADLLIQFTDEFLGE